jgi:hypothetical protein
MMLSIFWQENGKEKNYDTEIIECLNHTDIHGTTIKIKCRNKFGIFNDTIFIFSV